MIRHILHASIPFVAIGLVSFILYSFNRKQRVFAVATIASVIAFVFLSAALIAQLGRTGLAAAKIGGAHYLVLAWIVMMIYFLAEFRYRIRLLGSIMMPLALMLILIGVFDEGATGARDLPFTSGITIAHMIFVFLGFGMICLAFAASLLYLLKKNALKNHLISALDDRLPALPTLDRLMEAAFYAGFPAFTLGIILGIVHAGSAFQSGWIWHPTIIGALASWGFYSVLFFMRQSGWISSLRFATGIVILFGVIILSFFLTSHQSLRHQSTTDVNVPLHSR